MNKRIIVSTIGKIILLEVLLMIPALLVFLLGQDYLTEGIALSSVQS